MFVRVRYPVIIDNDIVMHYLVIKEFNFTRNATYDVNNIAQIFAQSPILVMIMGSQIHFTLSGNLFIKRDGTEYVVDGLYNSAFYPITFLSPRHIVNYFKQITLDWNNGKLNTETKKFTIQFVDNYNDSDSASISENFLPESFSYTITNREPLMINVSITGQIGVSLTGG
jgi:hypothetical protein